MARRCDPHDTPYHLTTSVSCSSNNNIDHEHNYSDITASNGSTLFSSHCSIDVVPRKSCLKLSSAVSVSTISSDSNNTSNISSNMPGLSASPLQKRRDGRDGERQKQNLQQEQQTQPQQQQNTREALYDAPGSRNRTVRFGVVEIREFERCVGDNPSCSSGVPIRYDWIDSSFKITCAATCIRTILISPVLSAFL